jgi:peroxiredoxin Q/BCP
MTRQAAQTPREFARNPMELHKKVADFALQDDQEQTIHLSDFAGKPVVLFFYPKADTPGCTIEACGFRDTFKKLQQAGAVVLGISRDTPKAQRKFREKYDLPYPLLADVDEKVCKQFDVLKEKNMYGKKVMAIMRKLPLSFTPWAAAGFSETTITLRLKASSSGRTFATASAGPPTAIASLPSAATVGRPKTGAATNVSLSVRCAMVIRSEQATPRVLRLT